ncbi:hypothetical protein V6U78_03940 [Marinospirillum sp. MEB164]|uniref:Uncharacterized protein n=1 Tax=Marinospirillum alkalitolerans TaxID=3123374 RepID=A0ABW8PV85_9GAMM
MPFAVRALVVMCFLLISKAWAAPQVRDPFEHRFVMIQSNLLISGRQAEVFEGKPLLQSPGVTAAHLMDALRFSVCPIGDEQQDVRLHRIETFGMFVRLIALSEGKRLEVPSTINTNQYLGLRVLQACEQGRYQRVLEAALGLVDQPDA